METNKIKKADKELTGKELVDMGFRIDSEGYLIATTVTYEVWFGVPWTIKQKKKS